MHHPFDPGPHDPRVDGLLGELPLSLLEERHWFAAELVERYAAELALEAAARLGLEADLAESVTPDELAAHRGFAAEFRPALASLLARLASDGELEAAGEPPRYRAPRPLRPSDAPEIRRLGLARDPAVEPGLALLDAAVAVYPAVATGEVTGEHALLGPARVGLWLDYFSNANPVYELSNRITAVAAANRLPPGPVRILEFGSGAGSAAEALLEKLARRGRLGDVAHYALTEPSPFFRRRAERRLRERFPGVPFEVRALDLDLPLAAQGAGDGYHLAYGVNVLHVARRLATSLDELYALLAPGGALVAGECLRLYAGQPVPADLVFELFRGFADVETEPGTRPHHGFLELAVWRRALAAAGFQAVEVVPDLERIGAVYPRFFAGALCGRRPVDSVSP